MHAVFPTRVVVFLLLLAAFVEHASAQTISLPNGTIYAAGPDYATDVLQDPWDFLNSEDITPDPDQVSGWTVPSATTIRTAGTGPAFVNPANGGWLQGIAANYATMTLLHRADALAINTGRTGTRFPIDPNRYRKVAVKMRLTGAPAGSQLVTYWFHAASAEGGNWINRSGGAIVSSTIPTGNSQGVYVLDLASVANPLPVEAGRPAQPYTTELVKGFRLDPVFASTSGVEIDWVRLTAANGQPEAALMPVDIAGCASFVSFTVSDTAGIATVITDTVGSGSSSRSFNYGIFPPGLYQVQANCTNGSSSPAQFAINTPPTVTVLDPDEAGNPATDYALNNRAGDRWDFEQATDVARYFNASPVGDCGGTPCGIVPTTMPGSAGNMLRATAVGATPGELGDPGLEMLNGALVPLNSRRHRIVTFSINNRRPYELTPAVGPVLRFLWGSGSSGDGFSMTVSQDLRVWPGMHTYTVDLGALSTTNGGIETECATCPTIPWMTRNLRYFRIDPHEYGDRPTSFDLDDITLAAPDEVGYGQQFRIRYVVADPDSAGASYQARIYREDWTTRTGRTLIANVGAVVPGNLDFTLDPVTHAVPPGTYAISIEVDEVRGGQVQTSRGTSSGPLVVVNPTASSPVLTVEPPVATGTIPPNLTAFTIRGCAYDTGATSGIGMDDLAANAIGLTGERAGRTIPLGFVGPPRGTLEFGPLGSPVPCPGVGAGSPFRDSGFRFVNAGLENGSWIIRVYARSAVSGQMVQFADIPITVGSAPLAPVNFQASAAGNTVTVSFQAPSGGSPVAGYIVEGATNPNFSPSAFAVPVGAPGTYSGTLGSGIYYLRAFSRDAAGNVSAPTAAVRVDVALPTPPGAPTLVAAQVGSNPVTLTWSAGAGGAPAAYTLYAGTSPGASNLAVAPVGLTTSISAVAPAGVAIFVRVVATNAAGSATSNEISFTLAPPPAPTISPAQVDSNRNVTLRWTSVAGAAGYTVIARYPGSPTVIATLPLAGTTITVPAPPGTFLVSVVATNGQGTSPESNQITVVVP